MSSVTPARRLEDTRPLSLRANVSWTFLGNVVYAASSWLMLVVLARLGTPELVGQFAIGLSITAPIILFASLQLRSVQVTDVKRTFAFGDYLGLRLVGLALSLILIVLLALTTGYSAEVAFTIVIIGVGKAVDAVSDMLHGLFQQHENMRYSAVSNTLRGTLSLILLAVGLVVGGSVVWAAAGWTLASVFVTLLYDIPTALRFVRQRPAVEEHSLRPHFHGRILMRLGRMAFPLGIAGLLSSLAYNVPRYFIERSSGAADLGIFVNLVSLMTVGILVINALSESAKPRLAATFHKSSLSAFVRLLIVFVGAGFMVGTVALAVVTAAGGQLLNLIYGAEYSSAQTVLVILTAASGLQFAYVFLGAGMKAMRNFHYQIYIQAAGLLTVIVLSALFVESHGLVGAAYAALAKSIVEALLHLLGIVLVIRQQMPSHRSA